MLFICYPLQLISCIYLLPDLLRSNDEVAVSCCVACPDLTYLATLCYVMRHVHSPYINSVTACWLQTDVLQWPLAAEQFSAVSFSEPYAASACGLQ